MAIKGKSRRRSRSRGVHTPPKPLITAKKTPFLARRDVRHILAVVLGVLVALGGLRVWQNSERTDALRAYAIALTTAQTPYTQNLGADSPTSLDASIRDFSSAKLGVAPFLKIAEGWEKDFKQARANVDALKPPKQVAAAQTWFLEALDGFIGAARLFNVAAQQRRFADLPAQDKVQPKLEEQVQVVIQHANETLTRARATMQRGIDILNAYILSWHVSDAPVSGGA